MSSIPCSSSSIPPDFVECCPAPPVCNDSRSTTPVVINPIFAMLTGSCADSRKETTLKMLSMFKHISESSEHYLDDKEGVPDAFFLYGVADSFNVLNFLGQTALMTFIDMEIEACELDKNTDAIKSREQIRKMFYKLEKYSKRIRNVAMSIPPSQITHVE